MCTSGTPASTSADRTARQTYNVIGNMNEFQLTIGETTFGGRPDWWILPVSSITEV